MKSQIHDVIIVGGGVSGTSLLYTLARYTDVRSVALIEKYGELAALNSSARANSQTLHCGDIETNYSLDKALKVQRAARMVENYATAQPDIDHLIFKYPKMVLGVGAQYGILMPYSRIQESEADIYGIDLMAELLTLP